MGSEVFVCGVRQARALPEPFDEERFDEELFDEELFDEELFDEEKLMKGGFGASRVCGRSGSVPPCDSLNQSLHMYPPTMRQAFALYQFFFL
jgi:hypothetical protein